jgi:hypothetical protein
MRKAFVLGMLAISAGCAAHRGPQIIPNTTSKEPAAAAPEKEVAIRPAKPSSYLYPVSACAGHVGTYLGDMKCQLSNGSVAQVLNDAEALKARVTAVPVAPRSPHSWALATSAITFGYDGYHHDLLAGSAAWPDAVALGAGVLSRWWGVNSRDDLLKELKWLQFQGHRAEFDALGRYVMGMSEVQLDAAIATLKIGPEERHRLEIVSQNYKALGAKSILAWDLIRFVSLCRWGYLVGYGLGVQ